MDLDVSKSLAGLALTGCFASYGIFQIISGIFGDKFKPQKVIFWGLLGSSVVNLIIWLVPNIYVIIPLWCINGVFQSLIWPPLVRLLVDHFSAAEYAKMVVSVSRASYVATVIIYLFVPAVISVSNWKWVFFITGGISLLFSFWWNARTSSLVSHNNNMTAEKENVVSKSRSRLTVGLLISMGVIPVLFSALVVGFMRDGISAWMPTYINEVYGMGAFSSILTGAVLPLGCALFLGVLKSVGERIGNELKAAALYYAVALSACFVLFICFSKAPLLDVFLMALITVCVHGVNLMLTCTIPRFFSKHGKSSTMSGVFNSAVYAGSAISTYGLASMATSYGWRSVTVVWVVASLTAFALCIMIAKKYENQ